MGKNVRDKNPNNPSGNEHPAGCVWGILHIIKYHHWHYVKKRLVHTKHRGNKLAAGVGNPISCVNACMPEDTDAKIDKSTAEGKTRQSIPAGINSVKARIKARIVGEISKKKGRHNRSASCPVRSQLKRTESIHRLEPSPHLDPIAEMVLNEGSPRIFHQNNDNSSTTSKPESMPATSYEEPTSGNNNCGESCPIVRDYRVHHVNEHQKDKTLTQERLDNDLMQDMLEKKLIHVKELDADGSVHHPKEYLEVLDIINVNKELLVKILHDPSSPLAQHFHNQQAVSAKMNLAKSESFPLQRGCEPIKLIYKHELISSPVKEEARSKYGNQVHKLAGSSSLKYVGEQSLPSIAEYSADGTLKLNHAFADNSSSGCAESLKNRGEDQVAIKRFKDLRQKIKHVISESRRERHMITLDAILHKIPHGQKLTKELEEEIVYHSKDHAMNREGKDCPASSYESDHSVYSPKKKKVRHLRRASSLNASLDRYSQLCEANCNKEAKCHTSERLKLRTERVGSPLQRVPKTLGRIFSLPEIKSYNYQIMADGSASRRSSFDDQNSIDFAIGSDNHLQLDAPIKRETENLAKVGEFKVVAADKAAPTSVANNETSASGNSSVDDNENLTAGKSVSNEEQDIGPGREAIINLAEPFPIPVPNINVSMFEGAEMELKPRDELDNLAKHENEYVIDTPRVVHSGPDAEKVVVSPSKHLSYDMSHLQVDARDTAEFNYVRDVLEQSGFGCNTWHSDDQPVDPLMDGDVKGCLVHDPDCSGNEEGGKCDHFVLFDLINEVLMEIYGRSYNYCPKPLSSVCHIPLMPAGHHVLKEVWDLVSWYLSLRPEIDQSLDCVVSRDLAKNDGWMNLQFDSECIGIELEDLIFDELLEEVSLGLWIDQAAS